MGGSQSSFQTDVAPENSPIHKQKPKRPPPRSPKQPQYRQGGLPDSLLHLISTVENECKNTMSMVKNIQNDYFEGAEEYLREILKQTENKLHEFNLTKNWPKATEQESERCLYNDFTELKRENQKLKEENQKLKEENKRSFGGLLNKPESGDEMRRGDVKDVVKETKKRLGIKVKESKSPGTTHADKDSILKFQEQINVLQATVGSLKSHCATLEERNQSLFEQKNDFMLRLSKITGEKLMTDNPAIANLNDPNRPTKLGEVYSEIYDNEWTDAFESLQQAGHSEEEAINTLRLTLVNVFQFCSRKSDKMLKKTEEAINILFQEYKDTEQENMPRHLSMSRNAANRWARCSRKSSVDDYLSEIKLQDMWRPKSGYKRHMHLHLSMKVTKPEAVLNQLKIFRKEVAESMVPIVQKAYLKASWNDGEYVDNLKPFIKKLLFLGWMMVVQSPPMALAPCQPDEEFNKNIYKEYTSRGKYISFVVWPALLLEQDGPVVGKGVAQGKMKL